MSDSVIFMIEGGRALELVKEHIAAKLALNDRIAAMAKSFRLEFDGCRRIEREEWDILVAQHKLAEKRVNKEST